MCCDNKASTCKTSTESLDPKGNSIYRQYIVFCVQVFRDPLICRCLTYGSFTLPYPMDD